MSSTGCRVSGWAQNAASSAFSSTSGSMSVGHVCASLSASSLRIYLLMSLRSHILDAHAMDQVYYIQQWVKLWHLNTQILNVQDSCMNASQPDLYLAFLGRRTFWGPSFIVIVVMKKP